MFPDELQEGIEKFVDCRCLHRVFEFFCHYVRRLYSDAWLTKKLKKYPERSFFQIVTPSDIAYIISLVKNGKAMWDQEMDVVAKNQDDEGEGKVKEKKKARPLFTSGMGKKRSFGVSLWNRVGLEYYHTAEDNWRKAYNSKEMFSQLCNGWERWEPKEKGYNKQAIKTWWKTESVNKLNKEDKEDEEAWYDKGGYTGALGVTCEWNHDEDFSGTREGLCGSSQIKKIIDGEDEKGDKKEEEKEEEEEEEEENQVEEDEGGCDGGGGSGTGEDQKRKSKRERHRGKKNKS